MFRGKELEGDCTLSQASIVNESTIDLLLRGAVVGGGNTLGKAEEEDMDYEEQAYSSITLQPSVKLISDAALKNDLKDVCAIDIDEENELGTHLISLVNLLSLLYVTSLIFISFRWASFSRCK